jgi:hypothetical protein
MIAFSSARFFANFFTSASRLSSRLIRESLAIFSNPQLRKGKRKAASSALASSSVFAVVVMLMFMPRSASILS